MADNITVLDSTGTSKNWATSEGSDSQHRQHVVPTDANGTAVIGTTSDAAVVTDTTGTVIGFLRGIVTWFARLGALDGAAFTAGSSYVWPGLAGVYQSTVGVLTAGQRGLARLTSRRAVVTAGDSLTVGMHNTSVSGAGDVEVSTTTALSGFAAPTTAFFDGADGGFGASPRYIRVPMLGWKEGAFSIYQALGVNITIDIYLAFGSTLKTLIYSEGAIASGSTTRFSPLAGGTGAATSLKVVPALNTPCDYLVFAITPASDPASGAMYFYGSRRA